MKQWILVGLSGLTLILVWGIVIIQVLHASGPSFTAQNLPTVERGIVEKSANMEEFLARGGVVLEKKLLYTTQLNNEVIKKDLSQLNLTNIDTQNGVPIDEILNQLGLTNE